MKSLLCTFVLSLLSLPGTLIPVRIDFARLLQGESGASAAVTQNSVLNHATSAPLAGIAPLFFQSTQIFLRDFVTRVPAHTIQYPLIKPINAEDSRGQQFQEMATIYFGYGSNLWKDQMKLRCSTSEYLGIARLNGYRWIINGRGYANVVQTNNVESSYSNEVWGLVYSLQPDDEDKLDINEGVPECYMKEDLRVDFWPVLAGGKPDVKQEPQKVDMLVYIDRLRVAPSKPWDEYVFRMNKGVDDAVRDGMPQTYVDQIIRPFIPDVKVTNEKVEKLAREQARRFNDES